MYKKLIASFLFFFVISELWSLDVLGLLEKASFVDVSEHYKDNKMTLPVSISTLGGQVEARQCIILYPNSKRQVAFGLNTNDSSWELVMEVFYRGIYYRKHGLYCNGPRGRLNQPYIYYTNSIKPELKYWPRTRGGWAIHANGEKDLVHFETREEALAVFFGYQPLYPEPSLSLTDVNTSSESADFWGQQYLEEPTQNLPDLTEAFFRYSQDGLEEHRQPFGAE